MKNILKLEALGLFLLFTLIYFHFYQGQWELFLGLFFVPDVSFAGYLISATVGARIYNFMHHQGVMAVAILCGWLLDVDLVFQMGLIFMAHSFFDRALGYGLKFPDSFSHTHLGWIGKKAEEAERL